MEGRATVDGKEVVRPAIPAEYMEQAFAYHHLVPMSEWVVARMPPLAATTAFWWWRMPPLAATTAVWKVLADKPVQLPAGGTATVQVYLPMGPSASSLRVALNDPPEGITIQSATPRPEGIAIVLRADAGKVKPGLRGNLIVDSLFETPNTPGQPPRPLSQRTTPMGTLPAIPFEVVGAVQARN